MNNKVNYKLIGLFVIAGLVMMLGFTYWMLKPSDAAQTQRYRIYFNESVFGLNMNAPVKYRGISVGKVVGLRINPKNTEQVEVTVEILKSTPIKENTIAKLTAQGITGLTYINLSLGSNDAPPLEAKDGEAYPVIQSAPSFFEHFEKSLGSLSTDVSNTLTKTSQLLNDDNQKNIALILDKTANLMNKMNKILDEKTIDHLHASAKNLDDFSYKLDKVMPKVDAFLVQSMAWETQMADSFVNIKETYSSMGVTMKDMAHSFEVVESDIASASLNIVPTINATLFDMQNTLIEFNSLMQEYKRSPNDMLFKKEEIKRGPGEK
ncbi:MlaD family protein [Sulfurimonas sp.]|uniref:MlaD family protein n=1 Tax=Sulfurimonas sp. TaxID=2022749 RepID=UPI0026149C22|nr:MlaD family protein [Sulfurimonas sp.]